MDIPTLDARVRAAFRLTCRKCGSGDVHLTFTEPEHISEATGWVSGAIGMGCNGCGKNDVYETILGGT
jgi:hypothetical protein